MVYFWNFGYTAEVSIYCHYRCVGRVGVNLSFYHRRPSLTELSAASAYVRRRVDESGFLEPNWSHGTKLGRFWDGDLGPLECVPATFVD